MPTSDEIRRLEKKWLTGQGWPKRLEWVSPRGIRGWTGQRVAFPFPIMAIVGENGSGKSTLLQAAACAYQGGSGSRTWYPTEFFPDTAWDRFEDAAIGFGYRQGDAHTDGSVRKKTSRWLGQTDRPERRVQYIDLNRIQPVGARVGYARIAKTRHTEKSAEPFGTDQLQRLSSVLGREYDLAKMALSDIDAGREIPVVSRSGNEYSGYHQGSGEITIAELLQKDIPKYSLVLIDEIESSLHPRAQRRLVRDLAEQCRLQECQIIFTTHSPYCLEELPLGARLHILEIGRSKTTVLGISPEFAMTKMDDDVHPECDLYVEDNAAQVLLQELLARHGDDALVRSNVVPYGAANVGYSLGTMVATARFNRPTLVFIDGDSPLKEGCLALPGGDAPEQVVFRALKSLAWGEVWTRVGRDISAVEDACAAAMTLPDHHSWVTFAAQQLRCGSEVLWRAMCADWMSALNETERREVTAVVRNVQDILP